MSEMVLHDVDGPVFRITLNRPDKRNALNHAVIEGIAAGLKRAPYIEGVRAIVLTGAGDRAFCAGGDLQPGGGFVFDFAQPRSPYGDLLKAARACPLPIVAAVNGACMAGGMGLLAMADLAISKDSARFGLPEAKIGLFPMQVMALMKEMVAPRTLRRWMLTGAPFDAAEALREGMLNEVVPDDQLDAATARLTEALAAASPTSLRRGKYALQAIEGMTTEQAVAFAEGQITLMALSEDAKEGLASFNEKRPPKFEGR